MKQSAAVDEPLARARPARSGVLLVSKAPGITSFGVVALVRAQLGVRRIGHGGTLDPSAAGVLPILIGEATKLMPYLLDLDKEYVVAVRLGVRTDTQDLTGRVLSTAAVSALAEEDLVQATRRFVGRQRQVPPMYSAIRQAGRRLYELARQGVEVPRPPRDVMVYAIAVEDVALPTVQLRIVCGKGTYVRALVADLGEALGCGAAVESLLRQRVGPYGLEDGVSSSDLAGMPAADLWARLLPPISALAGWPVAHLDGPAASAFTHGQPVSAPGSLPPATSLVAVDAGGDLLGVGQAVGDQIKPLRILHADRPGSGVLPA